MKNTVGRKQKKLTNNISILGISALGHSKSNPQRLAHEYYSEI